jgi:pimeloyl-ACP methyl ester carboxylesterase
MHYVNDQLCIKKLVSGWLALVAAQQLKQPVHGMLLYAPALNYVYPYYQTHLAKLPPDIRERVERGDPHFLGHQHMGSAMLKKDFAEDSRQHEIDLSQKVDITCPVRIMHGLCDVEVSHEQTLQLCQQVASNDVDVIFRKSGPHQLEQPSDIEIFLNTLDRMLKDHPV